MEHKRKFVNIPLIRPDLVERDVALLLEQLAREPFHDELWLNRWEACWATLWNRPAVAFADAAELVRALKAVLQWRSGDKIAVGPFLEPVWWQGFAAAWLSLVTDSGYELAALSESTLRAVIHHHPFGLPVGRPKGNHFTLEEVSSVLKPIPGCGEGDVQMMVLDGNRMIQGGASALLLSKDTSLIRALKKERRYLPSSGLCCLGLAQLARLDTMLARREVLASRYLAMRDRGVFGKPLVPAQGRMWDGFALMFSTGEQRDRLQKHLNAAGISAASPIWYALSAVGRSLDLDQYRQQALSLPLYASLTDTEQKKIINRVHRWIERATTD